MKIYRTTRWSGDVIVWRRLSLSRRQYGAAKSAWYTKYANTRITLEQVEIPDGSWESAEDGPEES